MHSEFLNTVTGTVFSGIMLGIIIIINMEGGLWWPAQYFVNRCLGWGNWRHTYQVPNFIYAAINLFRHHLTFLWFIFCSYGWILHLFQFNSIFPILADWFSFLKSLSLPSNMLVSYQNYKKVPGFSNMVDDSSTYGDREDSGNLRLGYEI